MIRCAGKFRKQAFRRRLISHVGVVRVFRNGYSPYNKGEYLGFRLVCCDEGL
jgi:hypothetical protein